MRRLLIILLALCSTSAKLSAQNAEVKRIMEYLMLAEEAGFNVQQYIFEISDQLAYASMSDVINQDILEQGEAAARLYAHPLVCNNFASCLIAEDQFPKAIEFLNIALQQDPDNPLIATNLAHCHIETGGLSEAERLIEKVLASNPGYGLALQLKAELLLNKGGDKNRKEAANCTLNSALDIWNYVSIQQFWGITKTLEDLYVFYKSVLGEYEHQRVFLPTPLDGSLTLFTDLLTVGQSRGAGSRKEFKYPVNIINLENKPEHNFYAITTMMSLANSNAHEKEVSDAIWGGIQGAMNNEFDRMAAKIKEPKEPGDYPTEYTGLLGGNSYMPDSQVVLTTLMIYSYYKIKLLEAEHNREGAFYHKTIDKTRATESKVRDALDYKDTETEKVDTEAKDATNEAMAYLFSCLLYDNAAITKTKMQEANEKHLKAFKTGFKLKEQYGEIVYESIKDLVNLKTRVRRETYVDWIKPVLEDIYFYTNTGLRYFQNKKPFDYISRSFDRIIYEHYENPELGYFSSLVDDLREAHSTLTELEDLANIGIGPELADELQKEMEKAIRDYEIDQNLRAIGMTDSDIDKALSAPSIGFEIGGWGFRLGVSSGYFVAQTMENGVTEQVIYNRKVGTHSTATIYPTTVDIRPYEGKVENVVGKEWSLGGFDGGYQKGLRVVRDSRGNIVDTKSVRTRSFATNDSFMVSNLTDNKYVTMAGIAKNLMTFDFGGLVDDTIGLTADALGYKLPPMSLGGVAGAMIGSIEVRRHVTETQLRRVGSSARSTSSRSTWNYSLNQSELRKSLGLGGF